MSRRMIVGLALVLTIHGCRYGGLPAADLPPPRPIPTLPDSRITAREPRTRLEMQLRNAVAAALPEPVAIWSLITVGIAF